MSGEIRDHERGTDAIRFAADDVVNAGIASTLRRLAAGEGGPVFAEIAEQVLAGRHTLAEILGSRAYEDELRDGLARTAEFLDRTPDSEIDRLAAEELGRLRAEIAG